MEVLGYGEDALTLWAINNKLSSILAQLGDSGDSSLCRIFFRPSFGRGGGIGRSEFGEFDFLLLSNQKLYLGESKWDRSSQSMRQLASAQHLRHSVFKYYVEEWFKGNYCSWSEFEKEASGFTLGHTHKPLAPDGSLLSSNLLEVLQIIKKHFVRQPEIVNVLMYFYNGSEKKRKFIKKLRDFEVVYIDYSEVLFGNFIQLKL